MNSEKRVVVCDLKKDARVIFWQTEKKEYKKDSKSTNSPICAMCDAYKRGICSGSSL